jgi:hypothetical protein
MYIVLNALSYDASVFFKSVHQYNILFYLFDEYK